MSYSLEKVTALIGAHRFGATDAVIDWLLTDSRSLAFPETTLFFALRTARGDGHRYLPDLYRRGVRNFVVEQLPEAWQTDYAGANFLRVVSPLKALQRLAERHREEYDLPVVGITGSNGKTVVKEWLYQLLSPLKRVTRSPRSYNSQIGVPLSVWLLDEHTEVGLFEAGISEPDEMPALRAIIQPTIGVLTHLGPAHQENFPSLEDKCLEKLELFKDAEVIVYNADSPVVADCVRRSLYTGNQLAWSRTDQAQPLFVPKVVTGADGTDVTYVYLGYEGHFHLPFVDEASVEDALHCLAVCLYLHVPQEAIARGMARLDPVAMRLEVKQGVRGCTIINDSYNSDVNSLDIALNFMQRRPAGHAVRHTLVLSDILQSGEPADALYARVATLVGSRGVDRLIGVGPELTAAAARFPMEARFFQTTDELLRSGLLDTLRDELVLVKGARAFHFERITERLALKVHETTLEVNLAALVDNLNYYRSFMRPDTRMVCMVKASAYGTGAVEVAKTLQDHRVDYLAVAVADEGVVLRQAGITTGILIMNPEMSALDTLFAYDLEPEVYSFRLLDALIHAAERAGVAHFPVHVKLDTGMHRLGFDPDRDVPALIDRLRGQDAVVVRSVFSHFAGSDEDRFDDFSAEQFDRFDRASRALQAAFPHRILRHICNSAGIERFPERHLDMVRLGLGLYGVDPYGNRLLHTVATLRTTILQIRDVAPTDTVGYSRRGRLDRPSRIAAIPIGYADGLDRHLGCGHAYCLVHGQRAPYVGNICMDVCMIDVTDIDCSEGDAVEIFGEHLPVTELSDRLGTIPYEVLTSVSERVKRVYFQE